MKRGIRMVDLKIFKESVVLAVLSIIFIGAAGTAAGSTNTWAKTYGGTYADSARSVQPTDDGGYIMAGRSSSFFASYQTVPDLWIVKVDSAGEPVWQKNYGPWEIIYFNDPTVIRQTADKGYIAAGMSGWDGPVRTSTNIRLLKLDADGNPQWKKTYLGSYVLSSIQVTGDNGYIVTGYTGSFSAGNYDALAMKLDASGNIEWQKTYGDWNTDTASDIAQTADGGYLMVGNTCQGWCGGMNQPFLLKLDPAGAIEWKKAFPAGPAWTQVQTLRDGGYVVASGAGALVKFNSEDGIEWQKQYSEANTSRWIYSLQLTADGGFVLGGSSYLYSDAQRSTDAWVVKLDQTGTIEWQKQYGGQGSDLVYSVQQTADSGFIAAGQRYTPSDAFLMKLDPYGNMSGCPSSLIMDTHAAAVDTALVEGPVSLRSADAGFTVLDNSVAATDTGAVPGGVCANSAPRIIVDPASLPFGPVELGSATVRAVSVTNTGSSDLLVGSITITGNAAGGYVQTNTCTTVAVGGSCTVTVVFAPTALGSSTGALRIASNDPDSPVVAVPLSGTGTDTLPPTTAMSVSGIIGSNDWYRSPVTVNLTATDSGSGVRDMQYVVDGAATTVHGGSASFTIAADGTHETSYHATDNAGESETPHTLSINIDQTPPSISASVSPLPNANGWNDTDVTVTFVCSDNLSGTVSCPSPIIVTTEGAGHVISGSVVDMAGNTASAAVTVNIDRIAPVVNISADPSVLWPPNHKMANVTITGSATDSGSSTASVVFTVVDEYGFVQPSIAGFNTTIQLEASRRGTDKDGRRYTITAIATDKAGNQATASTTVLVPHDRGDDDDEDD